MSSTNNTTAFQTNSRANAPDMTPDHFAPLFSDNSKRASLQGGMAIEIAAACFLALLLGWSSLSYPLGADQGILAVWAQELARGAVPYRDIWEQRPPLFYFLIYFGYLAGLREHLLVRVVDLILQIATAGVLSALGRRWFGRFAGILTGFFYAFSYFGMVSYHHQAQPESLYGLLLGIAFLLLDPWIQKAEDTPAWNFANKTRCFGAGVCCGLAFLSKYPIVLCLPVFFYVLFIKHALRACLWRWALWTMGALTPIILLCAWFWAIGALRNFVIDTIVFNFFHASRGVEGSALVDGVLRYYSPGVQDLFQNFVSLLLDKKEIIVPLLLLLIVKLPRRALIVSGLYLLCAGGGDRPSKENIFIPFHRHHAAVGDVSQLADEAVDADLSAAGMIGVPVVVVLVFAQLTVIGTHIAFQPGVVSPCAVNHDALDGDLATCIIAGVFCENQLIQIHYHCLLSREAVPGLPSAFQGWAVPGVRSSPRC